MTVKPVEKVIVKPVEKMAVKPVEKVKPVEAVSKTSQEDIKLSIKSVPPVQPSLQPVVDIRVMESGSTEMRKRLRSHSSSDSNEPVVKRSRQNSVSDSSINHDDVTTGSHDCNDDICSNMTFR